MIHELINHSWHIEYKNEGVQDESRIMLFSQGKVLVVNKDGIISYPVFKSIAEFAKDCGYLFSLDGESYFRAVVEEKLEDKLLELVPDSSWQSRHYFRTVRPKELILASVTAFHLDGWYSKNRLCGCCGTSLVHDTVERMLKCPRCGNAVYPRINPAVIVGVTKGDEILLTKYRGREYKQYALIAGFTEIGESFEDCVRREVMEEAGIKVKNIRYYGSQPWGFSDNILAGYFCEVDGEAEIKMDQEELSVAQWVHRADIPNFMEDLSLTHEMIVRFIEGKEK